jgi:1-deoxy-D-xylulose-5-phosphate reductoisomerase
MSVPDMRDCVQYALTYPARTSAPTEPLDFFTLGHLTFDRPDGDAFPLLPLAARAFSLGGAVPAVLNAANEEAVFAFLSAPLRLTDVFDVVVDVTERLSSKAKNARTLDDILASAREARALAREMALSRAK